MATYAEIQEYVKKKFGFVPKTCWIAHAKEISRIPVKRSHRRIGKRQYPCPRSRLKPIQKAFQHFGMM